MEQISQFIVNNWQYISIAIVILLEVILLILKKLKVNVKLPSNTYTLLLDLIKEAETIYGAGKGKEKLNYVLEKYCKQNEIKYFDVEVKYYLSSLIESILDTPQRKEKS